MVVRLWEMRVPAADRLRCNHWTRMRRRNPSDGGLPKQDHQYLIFSTSSPNSTGLYACMAFTIFLGIGRYLSHAAIHFLIITSTLLKCLRGRNKIKKGVSYRPNSVRLPTCIIMKAK
ncbi:unnamed protein product [Nesidiocoris tenuis]|uniref:Uncharacterized protein n=1 Tax=Nesidiocoris tenuis TaxID=355587 RepID=A0A6H5HLX2_9HEMI|nr:unnamed protein product [Nesidiocoris tenuis]